MLVKSRPTFGLSLFEKTVCGIIECSTNPTWSKAWADRMVASSWATWVWGAETGTSAINFESVPREAWTPTLWWFGVRTFLNRSNHSGWAVPSVVCNRNSCFPLAWWTTDDWVSTLHEYWKTPWLKDLTDLSGRHGISHVEQEVLLQATSDLWFISFYICERM